MQTSFSGSSRFLGAEPSFPYPCRSPKYSAPEIMISKCRDRKYWMVSIKCKDRNKLLFDTVCTLADLEYDVFHASIDSAEGVALQEYYIKSRTGGTGAVGYVNFRRRNEAENIGDIMS